MVNLKDYTRAMERQIKNQEKLDSRRRIIKEVLGDDEFLMNSLDAIEHHEKPMHGSRIINLNKAEVPNETLFCNDIFLSRA